MSNAKRDLLSFLRRQALHIHLTPGFFLRGVSRKHLECYALAVLTVLAVVLGIAWLYASGERFIRVSLICHGFFLGYLSVWFHIGRRHGFGKLSKYLTDNPDDPAR